MFYYSLWVAAQSYHGQELLTYHSEAELKSGEIVSVMLGNKKVGATVVESVGKPAFKTKPIASIANTGTVPDSLISLAEWMRAYYPAPIGALGQLLIPSGIHSLQKSIEPYIPVNDDTQRLPKLTSEQKAAIDRFKESHLSTVLLHGDTGTGKTRVYVELARETLDRGKSVIVLTPEIGLTTPLAKYFKQHLNCPVVIIHSALTPAERRKIWIYLANNHKPVVVIGPRSALFSPIDNLGLIVMDEAHDNAYKQDQSPRYQTSRVAAKLADLSGSRLLMGTATPLVADLYTLTAKQIPVIRLTQPAIKSAKAPSIDLIDINNRTDFKQSHFLSDKLIESVRRSLADKEQALLFLNRRGTARVILCQNCGWRQLCPNCDIALVYHGDKHEVRCHTCGYNAPAPNTCPKCGDTDIKFQGIGTKSLMDEVASLFRSAKIKRFDTDLAKNESLHKQFDDIVSAKVNILVGTQILSKGLDLPRLSTVGVVQSDTSLLIPDFSSNETAYQQLYQIIGRVGRGHIEGRVIVQSFNPKSPTITAATQRNFDSFYEKELKEREQFLFPPFCYLLKLSCSRASIDGARQSALRLKQLITDMKMPVEVLGPNPAFHEKTNNKYNWQLTIKTKQRSQLLEIIKALPANWSYDIDPINLL